MRPLFASAPTPERGVNPVTLRSVVGAIRRSGDDRDRNTEIILEIGPHPALSETWAKVIALDYGMSGSKAKIKVWRALLYYALRRLGLDTDPGARKPQDQQIVFLGREVIHEDHG